MDQDTEMLQCSASGQRMAMLLTGTFTAEQGQVVVEAGLTGVDLFMLVIEAAKYGTRCVKGVVQTALSSNSLQLLEKVAEHVLKTSSGMPARCDASSSASPQGRSKSCLETVAFDALYGMLLRLQAQEKACILTKELRNVMREEYKESVAEELHEADNALDAEVQHVSAYRSKRNSAAAHPFGVKDEEQFKAHVALLQRVIDTQHPIVLPSGPM